MTDKEVKRGKADWFEMACEVHDRHLRRTEEQRAAEEQDARLKAAYDSLFWNFEWVPEKLVQMWVMGVKVSMSNTFGSQWRASFGIRAPMVFFGCHHTLMRMLKVAIKSWRSSKKHEYQAYLASIVLAIECLGCDFAGWGTRYLEAKPKARESSGRNNDASPCIIAELENGAAPWIKPWSARPGANVPCNAVSNRLYSG
jgi:hypothetical protein